MVYLLTKFAEPLLLNSDFDPYIIAYANSLEPNLCQIYLFNIYSQAMQKTPIHTRSRKLSNIKPCP